jgi:hypothetical protein
LWKECLLAGCVNTLTNEQRRNDYSLAKNVGVVVPVANQLGSRLWLYEGFPLAGYIYLPANEQIGDDYLLVNVQVLLSSLFG